MKNLLWICLDKVSIQSGDNYNNRAGLFPAIWEKASGQYWEKMTNFTSKLEEINGIEHNKGSKIYPKNRVILDCIMPSIPLKHKCLSIILIWVIGSHK